MAKFKKPPSVVYELALEEVRTGFTPYYGNPTGYRLEPNTGESVNIVTESYDADDSMLRWEKVSFTLHLRDFIDSLGIKAYEKPLIKKLKPWGPGG